MFEYIFLWIILRGEHVICGYVDRTGDSLRTFNKNRYVLKSTNNFTN